MKQSESLLQEVQGGLSEFVSTVKDDTSKTAVEIEKQFANKTTDLVSTVTNSISTLIHTDATQSSLEVSSRSVFSDRKDAEFESIRRDPATYLNEPMDSVELAEFQKSFKLSSKTEEISKLLANHSAVRALHTRLVPAAVEHDTFWFRYFYRITQIENENSRRKVLLEDTTTITQEEEIRWDDDEDVPPKDTPNTLNEVPVVSELSLDASKPQEDVITVAVVEETSPKHSPSPIPTNVGNINLVPHDQAKSQNQKHGLTNDLESAVAVPKVSDKDRMSDSSFDVVIASDDDDLLKDLDSVQISNNEHKDDGDWSDWE